MQITYITRPSPAPAAPLRIPLDEFVSVVLTRRVWQVELMKQVGRFALVTFKTFGRCDRNVIICLEPSAKGGAFNMAMRRFQIARRRGIVDPHWYVRVTEAMGNLRGPLMALNPTRAEQDFVMLWAQVVRASGSSI